MTLGSRAVPATLPDLLDRSAAVHERKLALVMRRGLRDDRWTYQRLAAASHDWAALFHSKQIGPGERLLVQSPNTPDLVAAIFGAFRAGIVVVPLDLQSSPEFTRQIAEATRARAILSTRSTQAVAGLMPIAVDIPPPRASVLDRVAVDSDDLAEIVFTSGTTGQPKGVQLTHGNIASNVRSAAVLPHGSHHRLLSLLPLSHMLEQTGGLFFPLASGASVAFVTSLRPSTLMTAFQDRRPTTLVAVPALLELIMRGILRDVEHRGRLSHWHTAQRLAPHLPLALRRLAFLPVHQALGGSLRWIFSGGAPLAPTLQATWRNLGVTVMQGYGATECAPFVCCQRPSSTSLSSAGLALPGVEVRIAENGEICVRGPNVTSGYWEDPVATETVLQNGEYRTGDLGSIDPSGEVRILGRAREMIALPSGMNVFPSDVEQAILAESTVTDAAVVGWAANGSTAVHAVLVPAPHATRDSLIAAVRAANSRLASHQWITDWDVWPNDHLPVTSTRKLRRTEIVAWLEQRDRPSPAPEVVPSMAPTLHRILAETAHRSLGEISPTTELSADLGLDSLARVELAVSIEQQLGAEVSDEAIGQAVTVADLDKLISPGAAGRTNAAAPNWPHSRAISTVRQVLQSAVLFPLLDCICRPHLVRSAEHSRTLRGPMIIIANHASHLDAALVLRGLPARIRRRVAVAAAQDYFFQSYARALPAQLLLGAFPLARSGAVLPSMEHCGRLVDRGWSLLIFPEGTRSGSGAIGEFKPGIGLLARELHIPVLPIAIIGAHAVLPKGRLRPHPGPVRLAFGFPTRPMTDETDRAFAERLRRAVVELTSGGCHESTCSKIEGGWER